MRVFLVLDCVKLTTSTTVSGTISAVYDRLLFLASAGSDEIIFSSWWLVSSARASDHCKVLGSWLSSAGSI